MAKLALGKGLGELMNGGKAADAARPPSHPAQETDLFGGRGVKTLLNGSSPERAGASVERPQVHEDEPLSIPAWFFFGADLLLLGLALALVLGPKPIPGWNVALALISTALGCCSALVGVLCARK